jgi:hypothetical protein
MTTIMIMLVVGVLGMMTMLVGVLMVVWVTAQVKLPAYIFALGTVDDPFVVVLD